MPKKFTTKLPLEEHIKQLRVTTNKVVDDNFNFTERKIYESIIFSKFYFVIEIITFMFGLGIIMMWLRKYLWGKRLERLLPLNQAELYKKVVDAAFTNIRVEGANSINVIPISVINKNRGAGIPYYARQTKLILSPLFILDGSKVMINSITWKWRQGKIEYVVRRTYTYIVNTSQKMNDINFSIAKRSKISFNKGKDMDNDFFNKTFSFKHNNPVKFRMLFTVGSQEKFVKISKTNIGSKIMINKIGDSLIMSNPKIGTPFENNIFKIQNNQEELKKSFSDFLQKDFEVVLELFSVLYSMPGILEKQE